MAKATGMSQSAVSRIWRNFGLKPHLSETFKLSPDPLSDCIECRRGPKGRVAMGSGLRLPTR